MAIPCRPVGAESADYRFRHTVDQAMVHSSTQSQLPQWIKCHIISGYIHALKTIPFLEIAQAIALFVAIGKLRINKIWNVAGRAGSHRLSNQSICGCLLSMTNHRENMHQASLRVSLIDRQLGEANQFITEKGSQEYTTVEKSPCVLSHPIPEHSIVGKPLALTHRSFVVDAPYSIDKAIVERDLSKDNALLLRLLRLISPLKSKNARPPVVERFYRKNGGIVPLHGIGKLWSRFRKLLQKREHIYPLTATPQLINQPSWIPDKSVIFPLDPGDPDNTPFYPDRSVTNYDRSSHRALSLGFYN